MMGQGLEAMTDQEFNDFILGLRYGNGYIIPYPFSIDVGNEMARRDPSKTWGWGVENGPNKGDAP